MKRKKKRGTAREDRPTDRPYYEGPTVSIRIQYDITSETRSVIYCTSQLRGSVSESASSNKHLLFFITSTKKKGSFLPLFRVDLPEMSIILLFMRNTVCSVGS